MTTKNDQKQTEVAPERALAVINSETITLPNSLAKFADENGNLMTTKRYLCKANGLPFDAKQKLTDLKKQIGADKAKLQIKEYNTGKVERRVFDSKVWALVGADHTLRKSVKAVVNAKGTLIGFNGSARFTTEAGMVEVMQSEIAELRKQLAAMVAAKQTAPASK